MRRAGGRAVGWAGVIATALLFAFPPTRLPAQASSVVSFPGSTRSAGLAGAGVALVGDAGAMFANPAAIATVRHVALDASFERFPLGATLSSAAAAVRIARYNVGVAARVLRPSATPAQPTDLVLMSTLVFRFGMIAFAGSGKYVREGTATPQVVTYAGDIGVAMALFDILALGASVQNIGGDWGTETHLPRRTRVGFTMNYVDPQGTFRLLTTLEGLWEVGRRSVIVAGAEGGVVTGGGIGIIARAGVSGQASDLAPIALGAGIALGRVQLDYAYRSQDTPSGAVHRFGVRWAP